MALSPIQDSVKRCELPQSALLRSYTNSGAYTDCYCIETELSVSQAEYVEAFYTTSVFRLERLILKLLVSKPSNDADASRLAQAEVDSFAAWFVEDRAPHQLLLCDFRRRTRSWLMVDPIEGGGTRLYFGSAVVPARGRAGEARLGFTFRALLGFHKRYSRILLKAATARVVALRRRRASAADE